MKNIKIYKTELSEFIDDTNGRKKKKTKKEKLRCS
jgi:hypothetical protein